MAVVLVEDNIRAKYESIITSNTHINRNYIRTQHCYKLKTIIQNVFSFLRYEIHYSVNNPNFNKLDIIILHDEKNERLLIKVKHTFIDKYGYITIYTSENVIKICNRTNHKAINKRLAMIYLYIREHDNNNNVPKTFINNRLREIGPNNLLVIDNYNYFSHWPDYLKIPLVNKISYIIYCGLNR